MFERGSSIREWREVVNQFVIVYGDRFTRGAA